MAVLALAAGASLQAQAASEFAGWPQEGNPAPQLTDKCDLRPAGFGFSFPAEPTSTASAVDGAGPAAEALTQTLPSFSLSAVRMDLGAGTSLWVDSSCTVERGPGSGRPYSGFAAPDNGSGNGLKLHPLHEVSHVAKPADFNRKIYYRNKLEFGLDSGWLPYNIPFVFARLVGIYDRTPPRTYTLMPFIFSVRWRLNDIGGPWIFRGNWDFSMSGAYTMIPSGPETRYFAHLWGIRRNFVQRNWRIVPYWEKRAGVGNINAKEPYGAQWSQGQDLTFTVILGGGARYNFSPRYSISAGVNYMHISNLYLSEPRYPNYGINVYGPALGFSMRLGRPRSDAR